ncbi:hypothetical protein ACFXPA_42170 [Amycolatopsis sp. NPDC059090]|uniref:hypothetical protein n=1 Tax=Amycolatopsis sp. NPDC059090 TaxID=3346723 RepID=UPI0036731BC3
MTGRSGRARSCYASLPGLEALAVVVASTGRSLIAIRHYYPAPASAWILSAEYRDIVEISPLRLPGDADRPQSLTVAGPGSG